MASLPNWQTVFMIPIHKPVMADEIIHFFRAASQMAELPVFLDVTAGEGGHSERILQEFPKARLFLSDRDSEMLDRATTRLAQERERITPILANFSTVHKDLAESVIHHGFDGIVADLGISMFHILESGRGFSFKKEEELDMRLDHDSGKTAADILNQYPEKELLRIFYEYGEERWSKKIAERIIEQRKKKKFTKTEELAELVERTVPRKFWPQGRHPSFRIFQALRIEVNQELEHIRNGMQNLSSLLKKGGVLCMISFHSLEDRIVKHGMRELAQSGEFEILTKKPLLPTEAEIADNISSRSAKLRVLRRR